MKRSGPPKRRTPLRKVNPERKEKQFEEAFGPYAAWLRDKPCLITGAVGEYVDLDHVRTQGARGKAEGNLVPLRHDLHMERHTIGIRTFETKYGLDLKAEAEKLYTTYLKETG